MRLLLDTHIYLWWLIDDVRLSAKGRATIASATEVFVSSASIWEASIKVGLGKLNADISRLVSEIAVSGFRELPVTAKHASAIADLPNVHRDPFDRMLIAQAMTESVRLLTADILLGQYTDLVELA